MHKQIPVSASLEFLFRGLKRRNVSLKVLINAGSFMRVSTVVRDVLMGAWGTSRPQCFQICNKLVKKVSQAARGLATVFSVCDLSF